jgi:hypothetical protein
MAIPPDRPSLRTGKGDLTITVARKSTWPTQTRRPAEAHGVGFRWLVLRKSPSSLNATVRETKMCRFAGIS